MDRKKEFSIYVRLMYSNIVIVVTLLYDKYNAFVNNAVYGNNNFIYKLQKSDI